MGKVLDSLDDELAGWIQQQPVFFVATAPVAPEAHINCSPKGGDCFRVLDPNTVAYLDYTGSGAETIAHLRENGRITLMFCAFEGKPNIVRLYGRGETITLGDPRFESLSGHFQPNPGARAVIRVTVSRISTTCGFAVPIMDFCGHRDTLDKWAAAKGEDALVEYRREKNSYSIDGLPAYEEAAR